MSSEFGAEQTENTNGEEAAMDPGIMADLPGALKRAAVVL